MPRTPEEQADRNKKLQEIMSRHLTPDDAQYILVEQMANVILKQEKELEKLLTK